MKLYSCDMQSSLPCVDSCFMLDVIAENEIEASAIAEIRSPDHKCVSVDNVDNNPKTYVIEHIVTGMSEVHATTFYHLKDAQLWWDTINHNRPDLELHSSFPR